MTKDWSDRLYEVINEMPLDEEKLLELLEEDWSVSEYRDAVESMGSPGVVLDEFPDHEGHGKEWNLSTVTSFRTSRQGNLITEHGQFCKR